MNPDTCPDCGRETWYCDDEERWFHVDPKQECFLTYGKTPPTPQQPQRTP